MLPFESILENYKISKKGIYDCDIGKDAEEDGGLKLVGDGHAHHPKNVEKAREAHDGIFRETVGSVE